MFEMRSEQRIAELPIQATLGVKNNLEQDLSKLARIRLLSLQLAPLHSALLPYLIVAVPAYVCATSELFYVEDVRLAYDDRSTW